MKKIRFQKWTEVYYKVSDLRRFVKWSDMVFGKGDETLKPNSPRRKWKKLIILIPRGRPETEFRVGFQSGQFNIKVSSVIRKIADGPFAMRMGPQDCHFFAVGTGQIKLENGGYVRKDISLQ